MVCSFDVVAVSYLLLCFEVYFPPLFPPSAWEIILQSFGDALKAPKGPKGPRGPEGALRTQGPRRGPWVHGPSLGP